MKVVYIQDQEIVRYKGDYYHSKSEHFFERYLAGLGEQDSLTVCCGVIDSTEESSIRRCKKVSHPQIEFIQIPEFRKIRNLFSIYSQIRKVLENADFCYLRSGIAASFAGSICRNRRIPYMAIVNEDVFMNLWMHPNKIFKLFAYPLSWMTHRMIKKANYACYVTQTYLQNRYPCKGPMCGCSDIEFLELDEAYLNKRIERIEEIASPLVLGTVGSVSARLKGQDTVIRVLANLKKKGIVSFRYELVGSGNPQRLSTLAKELCVEDLVKFKGPFSHDDVLKWFETIDIYIHPSHSEGLPRTILEAMTKATPCICTKVGGIPELIDQKFLFDYNGNEVEDLSNLLLNMSAQQMREEAKKNHKHSYNYNPAVLERKRAEFFTKAIIESKHV